MKKIIIIKTYQSSDFAFTSSLITLEVHALWWRSFVQNSKCLLVASVHVRVFGVILSAILCLSCVHLEY